MGTNELHPHFVVVMIKFMNNILIITDICEIIIDNLVNFKCFLLLQIGPKNLGIIII